MSWRRHLAKFGALFRRRKPVDDLAEEIRSHLEMEEQENLESGMPPDEAHYAALRRFGNVTLAQERSREMWGWNSVETLWQDVRFGLRQLRRNPGFTAVAVLTLAIGIGANTAIFSVVNAVLLRSLPFANPSRLIALHEGIPKMGYPKMGFSPPDLAVFAREQKSFSAIGAFRIEHVDISGQGEPERVVAARVSPPLFPMLGAEPMLGRTFAPEEDAPGHNVALLSHGLWQRRYGGAANIIGQTIELDRQPYTVVGIMERNFEFPLTGPQDNGSPADLWVPMAFTPAELQDWGGSYLTSVVGRLRPGVTLGQARSEAGSLSRVVVANYPPALTNTFRAALELNVSASPLQEDVVGSVRTLLLVLMAAVAFVLLIACANVAALLISRAATRQKEIAVRTALGATRLRLVRQALTESLLLALSGGAPGFALAFWGRNVILALVPGSVPLPRQIPLNGDVLAFALAASFLAALLFGLAPAFQVSALAVQGPLQEGGRSGTPGKSRHRLQRFFATGEFALALILLVGAGLLIRSFGKLLATRPSFRPDHVLTLNIPLPRQAYPKAGRVQDFYKQLLERVSNLPGVQTAGLSNDLPLLASEVVSITVEGRAKSEGETPQPICQSWVLGSYFETMGIPLVQGRWFTPEDRLETQPVAIVSLSMARKFWPRQDVIGKRIRWGVMAPWETIVGIVGDVSQGPFNTPLAPHVYRPYIQLPGPFLEEDPFSDWHAMNLALRTHADPASLTSAVLAQVHSLDPDLAVASIRTMTQVISSSVAGSKYNTILLGTFASLALLLAAIGVYGVLSYAVAQQRHEIGIRMALGAEKLDVLTMVVKQGMKVAAIGVGIGIVGALALTRLLSSLLYGVKATDPLTFIVASLLLITVAVLASYIPARRATKVDPMVALRYE
jgi:predicted permease